MLFLPSLLSPENYTFDALNSQTFYWQSNGDAQTDYKFVVYNIVGLTIAYDSGKITSTSQSHVLSGASLTNGNDYAWSVYIYHNLDVVQSELISIKTAIAPTVTLEATPTNVQNFTFISSVVLDINTSIQKFQYILYDSSDNIITDYGDIYSLNIQQLITGLISDTLYKIECIVTDQNNQIGTTGKVSFTVFYSKPVDIPFGFLDVEDEDGYMQVRFIPIKQIEGVVTGTYSFVAGKVGQGLSLDFGSFITFSENIPEYYTINLWVKLPIGFNGTIVRLGSGINMWTYFYDGERFGYTVGDFITGSYTARILPTDFFLIGIKYGQMIIKTENYIDII